MGRVEGGAGAGRVGRKGGWGRGRIKRTGRRRTRERRGADEGGRGSEGDTKGERGCARRGGGARAKANETKAREGGRRGREGGGRGREGEGGYGSDGQGRGRGRCEGEVRGGAEVRIKDSPWGSPRAANEERGSKGGGCASPSRLERPLAPSYARTSTVRAHLY